MKKYIIIKADTNDADYVTSKNEITDEKIELIKPVLEVIKSFKPYKGNKKDWEYNHTHNYPAGEVCREDLGEKTPEELYGHLEGFELFNDLVPTGEYGIHTIESVEIITVTEEIKLL